MKHFNRFTIFELERFIIQQIDKIFILPVIALIPFSFISIVLIQWKLMHYDFSFTLDGIKFYLSEFSSFKSLYTATLAICTTYWGILSIKQKIKQDSLIEWKTGMEERINEKRNADPIMCREIIRNRTYTFTDLHSLNLEIKNKDELLMLFDRHFSPKLIAHFETENLRRKSYGCVYPNETYSYSLKSFQFIFFTMVKKWYSGLPDDLQSIYLDRLNSMKIHKIIDQKLYEEKRKEEKNGC